MKKRILISGITGQDGSYMAEYCLNLGHEVYGMVRRTSQIHDKNFKHLIGNPDFHQVYGDLLDGSSLNALVQNIRPDYFINFAAQSFVGVSWKIPEETFMAGAVGVLKCLEAIRNYAPACRFYNAGSSEQFGDVKYSPQNEEHPFRPRSPYGAAKAAAHHLVKVYRESYNIYAIQGLLFNHESERRGPEFVTRKITKGIARICAAIEKGKPIESVKLGNLSAKRDWCHAIDFMDGIWRMLNQEFFGPIDIAECRAAHSGILLPKPIEFYLAPYVKEYVLASGETHTIRDFASEVAKAVGINYKWIGEDGNEKMVDLNSGQMIIEVDQEFFRPNEVNLLIGDASRAKNELGWEPNISFDNLANRMITSDLHELNIDIKSFRTTQFFRNAFKASKASKDNPINHQGCC